MGHPFAVPLCNFSDDLTQPYPLTRYEDIFTSKGQGRWSIPDYFEDISHGRVDMSGNRIFGWLDLDKNTADYTGSGANPAGRDELIAWARAAAEKAGHDLSGFGGVIVVLNYARDLFGGGAGVVCGDDGLGFADSALSAGVLGQEICHNYGLNHSRIETMEVGDPGVDYTDPFDVMSTAPGSGSPHPWINDRHAVNGSQVFHIGPGLNAANMDAVGWLDHDRVVSVESNGSGQVEVNLRPLYRRDLPGPLAIKFDDWYIEFRDGQGWDASFRAGVQVHTFVDGNSYLQRHLAGNTIAGSGDSYGTTEALSFKGSLFRVHVRSIDTVNNIASVLLAWKKPDLEVEVIKPPITVPHLEPWLVWSELSLDELQNPG